MLSAEGLHGMNAKLTSLLLSLAVAGCAGERGDDRNRNLDAADGGSRDASLRDGQTENDRDGAAEDASALEAGGSADAQLDASDDASVDASAGDAAAAGFSITVRSGPAAPLANVPVWFHDATGALLSQHVTGADGRVTSEQTPAMVTAVTTVLVENGERSEQPITFTSLTPGDQLVVELSPKPWVGNPNVAYQLTHAAPPIDSYSLAFAGLDGCAIGTLSGTGPSDVRWPVSCPVRQTNSLLAIAASGAGEVISYAFAKGAPSFGSAPVAVTLGAWTAPSVVHLTFSNLPLNWEALMTLGAWSDGVRFETVPPAPPLAAGSPLREVDYPTPSGFADDIDVIVSSRPTAQDRATMLVRQAPAAQLSVDYAQRLRSVAFGMHATESGRQAFSWTPEEELAAQSADNVVVQFRWVVPSSTGETYDRYGWLIVGPPNLTRVALPEPPPLPGGPVTLPIPSVTISYYERTIDSGYRSFLSKPVRPGNHDDQVVNGSTLDHPIMLDLSAVGAARVTTWIDQPPGG